LIVKSINLFHLKKIILDQVTKKLFNMLKSEPPDCIITFNISLSGSGAVANSQIGTCQKTDLAEKRVRVSANVGIVF
jgi:hypothetical protein